MQFSSGAARFGDFEAAGLDADLSLDRGLVDIAAFDARDFAGADIHLEGTLLDPFGTLRPDLSLEVSAEDPSRLAEFLRRRLPDSPLAETLSRRAPTLGPLTLGGTATSQGASRDDLALDLSGSAGGTEIALRLAIENGLAATERNGRFGLDLSLAQADADRLLAQAGLSPLPIGATMPLDVTLAASGMPDAAADVSLTLRSTGSEASADGTATIGAEGLQAANLSLRLASEDAAPWATRLGLAFGQPLEGLPASGTARLSWADGGWTLRDLAATIDGSQVAGALSAPKGAPVTGTLDVSALSLDWLGTLVTGIELADAVGGDAPTPFASPLLPAREFQIAATVARAAGLGLSLSDVTADVAGDGTRLALSGLAAETAAGGQLTGSGEVRNAAGILSTPSRHAPWRPADRNRERRLRGPARSLWHGVGGGENWPALLASLDGRGRLGVEGARLAGVRPDLLPPVLEASEGEGFETGELAVAALVDRLSQGASASLGTLSADWTMGAGVLRTAPMQHDFDGASLEGAAAFDLRSRRVDAGLVLTLVPPADDAIADAPPSVGYRIGGPLAEPTVETNIRPLATYLSALGARREEERIEAIEDDLRETVRLRREARVYRERETVRDTFRREREAQEAAAHEEAARQEAERAAREREAAARREAEAEASRRAEAAREAAAREDAARAAAAQAAREALPPAPSTSSRPPPSDFELQPLPPPAAAPGAGFGGLPGVSNPNGF